MHPHINNLPATKGKSTDSLLKSLSELASHPHSSEEFLKCISATSLADLQSEFHQFLTKMASADKNWKLWKQFTFEDCTAFTGLYLAVRSGNWLLRVKCLKDMAPLFFTFHRPHYRKLISQHLADLVTIPSEILQHFQAGGFTASITGKGWHSVAIDEAHKMLINKDLKSAVVQPKRRT